MKESTGRFIAAILMFTLALHIYEYGLPLFLWIMPLTSGIIGTIACLLLERDGR